MIADVNDGGPANIRYIHWKSDQDFKVVDVLCYEKKRLTAEDMQTQKSYIQAYSSPILNSDWANESAEFTDYIYGGSGNNRAKIWRVVGLTPDGKFETDDVKEMKMFPNSGNTNEKQCKPDKHEMGYDCSEEADTIGEHYRMEMKLDGGKSITYASLLFLEDGDGSIPCVE